MKQAAPFSYDNLDLYGRLVTLYRMMRLNIAGIRYTATLLRFVYKDMVVLWRFHRCRPFGRSRRSWVTRIACVTSLGSSLQHCAQLFLPVPPYGLRSQEEDDQYDARRYQQIYGTMRTIHTPSLDLVSTPPARKLQAILARYVFQRLLGLSLLPSEAHILAYKGGPSVMTREFLEFCGCPHVPLRRLTLERLLPFFLASAQESQGVLGGQQP